MGQNALTRWLVVLGSACAVAASLAACGSDSGGDSTSADADVSVALAADPASLDPAKVFTQADAVVARGLYDTLVRVNTDGEFVAGLATKWDVEPDRITFTLRDDVTCSDGSKLTPTAVADSLTRLVDPDTGSQGAPVTTGGRQMTAKGDDAAGTVTVGVDSPWSELLSGLSMPWAGIVCPAGLKDPEALVSKAFGTGPFTVESVQRGRSIALAQRKGYDWAPKLGNVGEGQLPTSLTFRIVLNESTTANLMLSGKVDGALLLGPEVERLEGSGDFTVEEKAAGTSWLSFNQAPGKPLADEATRRAIATAINRKAFMQAANDGRGELTPSPVAPDVPCFDANAETLVPSFDPDAARAELSGTPKLSIIGTTQIAGGAGTQYVQAALKDVGVEASLRNSDNTAWSTQLFGGKGDWDLTVMYALNPVDSMFAPMSLLFGAPPPKGTNFSSIDNPAFTAAVEEATAKVGDCAPWTKAQEDLLESSNILPLATLPISVVLRDGLTGLAPQGGLLEVGTLRVR